MDHSKFVERAFRQMDINSEGESNQQLDVCEFFIGLMNFCFFPQEKLSRFMFDLYDDDKNGSITIAELELMITEICGPGKEDLVKKLMQLLDGDGSLDISYTEFMRVEKKAIQYPCGDQGARVRRWTFFSSPPVSRSFVFARWVGPLVFGKN